MQSRLRKLMRRWHEMNLPPPLPIQFSFPFPFLPILYIPWCITKPSNDLTARCIGDNSFSFQGASITLLSLDTTLHYTHTPSPPSLIYSGITLGHPRLDLRFLIAKMEVLFSRDRECMSCIPFQSNPSHPVYKNRAQLTISTIRRYVVNRECPNCRSLGFSLVCCSLK